MGITNKKLNEILKLTKEFISIPSTSNNPDKLQEILSLALLQLKSFNVKRFERNGISSALISNTKRIPNEFRLILNAHLDVVEGKTDQYTPVLKAGKLYGRGANDMKAAAAVLILLFKHLAHKVNYPLALQLVTDEEIADICGTKYQIEKGIRGKFVIAGEPTNLCIKNKLKGFKRFYVDFRGTSAHSAKQWKGTNAILEANKFITKVNRAFPVPKKESWTSTVNVSMVKTNNSEYNIVPDNCQVFLDVRNVPKNGDIMKIIKSIVPNDATITMFKDEPALDTDGKSRDLQSLKRVITRHTGKTKILRKGHGSSDIRHFATVGCDGVEFGPIGDGSHSEEEWVSTQSLKTYYDILEDFVLNLE